MAAVENVMVWEETLEITKPVSPKAKALADRLLNTQLEKDDSNLKLKVEERLAKAAHHKEQMQEENITKLKQKNEQHAKDAAARQMEVQSAKDEVARKDRLRQEESMAAKARLAAERAEKMAQREHDMEEKRLARLQQEGDAKQRHVEKLAAMEERLAKFNLTREEQCKDMTESHLARVARREALLDRMHDTGILHIEQRRQFQEQKAEEAEARHREGIAARMDKAASVTKHAAEVAAQVKEQQEAQLAQKKLDIDTQMQAAAERRAEQILLPQSQRTPSKARSPSPIKARTEGLTPVPMQSDTEGDSSSSAIVLGISAVMVVVAAAVFYLKTQQ